MHLPADLKKGNNEEITQFSDFILLMFHENDSYNYLS